MNETVLKQALHFLNKEKQFHLGMLPTEQSHPLTETLSETMKADTCKGLQMLFSVDAQLSDRIADVYNSEAFDSLTNAFTKALQNGHRIFFSGCGATGRLSLIIESAWREFWSMRSTSEQTQYGDRILGMITGGDRAMVRSVENFEDYDSFGRKQLRDNGITAGDVLVAVSEGGETSSVIGSAWQGLESGAEVFFAFNNPPDLLSKHVTRSRELIGDPRVTVLDLTTGPMGLAGSTRMQAVTIELAILAAALEIAISHILGEQVTPDCQTPATHFNNLVEALTSPENIQALAGLVACEEACYRAQGLITYITDHFLLDLMQDTTERAPTFSLPPFRATGDRNAPNSWAFIKHPALPTPQAWQSALGHAPRGLEWTPEDYRKLGATEDIYLNPPPLSATRIHAFGVGNEPDPSRQNAACTLAIQINVAGRAQKIPPAFENYLNGFTQRQTVAILAPDAPTPASNADCTVIRCPMPASPLRLWERLALKLVFNNLSTATMVRMDYVAGNWMSRAEASNKKLIDRGIRLVAQLSGHSYKDACIEFHQTLNLLSRKPKTEQTAMAPAVVTLQRLSEQKSQKKRNRSRGIIAPISVFKAYHCDSNLAQ